MSDCQFVKYDHHYYKKKKCPIDPSNTSTSQSEEKFLQRLQPLNSSSYFTQYFPDKSDHVVYGHSDDMWFTVIQTIAIWMSIGVFIIWSDMTRKRSRGDCNFRYANIGCMKSSYIYRPFCRF